MVCLSICHLITIGPKSITLHHVIFQNNCALDVMQLFTSTRVCESILGDVIQGGVCLVSCPVLATPQLHYINCLELIFENVM